MTELPKNGTTTERVLNKNRAVKEPVDQDKPQKPSVPAEEPVDVGF